VLSLEVGIGFRLDRLVRTLRRGWAGDLADLGLSPPQAAILRGIDERPGTSIRAVARRLGSDPMNVKRCVDDLEGKGLVRSGQRPDDRRPRTLVLTDDGRALVKDVDRLVRNQQAWIDAALSLKERRGLEVSLDRLEAVLGLGRCASDPTRITTPATKEEQ